MPVVWHPSPNFGPRRDGLIPTLIVLHFTAMTNAKAALDRLCDPLTEVSAHYLIGGDGTVWQMVQEQDRAWHAGAGEWAGVDDINSRSIGIELDNRGDHPFSALQMAALEQLMPQIMKRWAIRSTGVIAHSDMAPGRKCDPGRRFDWQRLARFGLAVWPEPVDPPSRDVGQFRALARDAGFTADVSAATLLEAVRLRFRPWGQGALCAADMAALAGLVQAFATDGIDHPDNS
ncbi:MAG: N-acetylmuramoyl-L-alanine amidase [Rhodobacteraceae bacterium]|nr:N-acetylmuramoyl-L-alanine amidase [Paracoccaceae bacterium]